MSKPKENKPFESELIEDSSVFSLRPDTTRESKIPSITKLLNRRSLTNANLKAPDPKPLPPTAELFTSPMDQVPQSPPPLPAKSPGVSPLIKKQPLAVQKSRRAPAPPEELLTWTLQQLKDGGDPMGQGLAMLFATKSAEAALFLAIQPKTKDFRATASVNADHKHPLWVGLTWDPNTWKDIWTAIQSKGYAEFQPHARNVVRTAFDVQAAHWFTLIRVGTPQRCRGIIAIISTTSLTLALQKALPHFFDYPSGVIQKAG